MSTPRESNNGSEAPYFRDSITSASSSPHSDTLFRDSITSTHSSNDDASKGEDRRPRRRTSTRQSTEEELTACIAVEENQGNVEWIPDGLRNACYKCDKEFTTTRRRHHCRHCGDIFCSNCSKRKMALPSNPNRPVRICDTCFDALLPASFRAAVNLNKTKDSDGGSDQPLDSDEEELLAAIGLAP